MNQPILLYIGNKNYSSWSFRAWLVLMNSGIVFKEVTIPLRAPASLKKIHDISPSGKVPSLHHDEIVVWDSLSICEYINELTPNANLWPSDQKLRALARSVCFEMHSSFTSLRSECEMNMKRDKYKKLSNDAHRDIERIYEIWSYCKKISGSKKYLFGNFTIADAFFAPVVSRIKSYQIPLGDCEDYINIILDNQYYKQWYNDALQESFTIESVDNI